MGVEVELEVIEINIEVDYQEKGDTGEKPSHEWNGTKLSFENPDGTMGEEVELMPQITLEIDENMHLIATI